MRIVRIEGAPVDNHLNINTGTRWARFLALTGLKEFEWVGTGSWANPYILYIAHNNILYKVCLPNAFKYMRVSDLSDKLLEVGLISEPIHLDEGKKHRDTTSVKVPEFITFTENQNG